MKHIKTFENLTSLNIKVDKSTKSAKFYDYILDGAEASEENAYIAARNLDWSEIESGENEFPYLDFIDTVNGIDIYLNFDHNSYYFAESE